MQRGASVAAAGFGDWSCRPSVQKKEILSYEDKPVDTLVRVAVVAVEQEQWGHV